MVAQRWSFLLGFLSGLSLGAVVATVVSVSTLTWYAQKKEPLVEVRASASEPLSAIEGQGDVTAQDDGRGGGGEGYYFPPPIEPRDREEYIRSLLPYFAAAMPNTTGHLPDFSFVGHLHEDVGDYPQVDLGEWELVGFYQPPSIWSATSLYGREWRFVEITSERPRTLSGVRDKTDFGWRTFVKYEVEVPDGRVFTISFYGLSAEKGCVPPIQVHFRTSNDLIQFRITRTGLINIVVDPDGYEACSFLYSDREHTLFVSEPIPIERAFLDHAEYPFTIHYEQKTISSTEGTPR